MPITGLYTKITGPDFFLANEKQDTCLRLGELVHENGFDRRINITYEITWEEIFQDYSKKVETAQSRLEIF